MDDLLDRGHWVAGREALAEAGADQQVTLLDISGIGYVPQFKAFRVPGAAGNGAQAVAIDLHGDAVGGVRQQQDARCVGHQLDHLAHQATGIEHRLAEHHAVTLALVDDDAMGEGIGVHADQLGHFDLFVDQRGGIEQLAQPNVLLGEGGKLLHAALQQQVFGLEFFVLGDQFGAAAELAGHALVETLRQVGDPVSLHQYQRHLTTHRLEQRKARIDHHQRDRKHGQHQQAHAQ
ncbi:hypothetical protein [Pseudomonas sp. 24 E 13]|nr:hypothetical protein [Pseudomonas sp. 24 E 13]CRN01734.1 hypothetical protein [Pseudomonas sp. 34 E 7]